jgi:hypothetical protein
MSYYSGFAGGYTPLSYGAAPAYTTGVTSPLTTTYLQAAPAPVTTQILTVSYDFSHSCMNSCLPSSVTLCIF